MNKKKNKYIIMILFIGIVFMASGYAALSSRLNITSSNSSNGNWDVKILDATVYRTGGNAVNRGVVKGANSLSAEFMVDLFNIGDYIEYSVTVKNSGNIKAKLNNVSGNNTGNSSSSIQITNGASALIGNSINPGQSMNFIVRIEVIDNNSEIEDVIDWSYNMILDYIQDNS